MPRASSSRRTKAARAASAADRDERESRLQLAAAELASGAHASIKAAARAHDVPEATLRHRMRGRRPKKEAQTGMQALSPAAETALVDYIRRCSCSGFPLTPAHVRSYASTIARPVPGHPDPIDVGEGWFRNFLLRHPDLKSSWSRCLDNARLKATDEAGIRSWFDRLADIIREYGVASTDVFNMDETGCPFRQTASERVVVPDGDPAARFKSQATNREMATAIECIGSGGQVLPPLIITRGKVHTVGEHRRMEGVPTTWHFAKSANGWTSNELAVQWVETIFDPNTRPSSPSKWRLLIINGHVSHVSDAFLNACWSRRIIPFLLPPHSTHVMQPLDVSIFGPLTAAYNRLLNDITPHIVGDIDKARFATIYAEARGKTMTSTAARKAFTDSGISLNPSPDKVLARLPGASDAARRSGTQERRALQPMLAPQPNAAVDYALDDYRHLNDKRDAHRLKRAILEAFDAPLNTISVLQSEIAMLRAEQDRIKQATRKTRSMPRKGDLRVISRENMISRDHAERELAAKAPVATEPDHRHHLDEEEHDPGPSTALVDDGDEADDDADDDIDASFDDPPPPRPHTYLDDLDAVEPFDTTNEDDSYSGAFWDELPAATSSHIRL